MQPPPIGRALLSLSPSETSIPSARIFSATAGEVPLSDILQEPLRRLLHEVHHALEALRTTVVRVRYLAFGRVGREVEERPHHRTATTQGGDHVVVLLVHREDVVEVLAVVA